MIGDRTHRCDSRCFVTSNGGSCAVALESKLAVLPIRASTIQSATTPPHLRPSGARNPASSPFAPATSRFTQRPNPHSARGTAGALPPAAISCLGAFRTPAVGTRAEFNHAGVRKPAHKLTHAPQQNQSRRFDEVRGVSGSPLTPGVWLHCNGSTLRAMALNRFAIVAAVARPERCPQARDRW